MNRLYAEWLPAFCNDPKRKYHSAGFKPESIRVSEFDAKNFIRALNGGLVKDSGGGRYICPRSNVFEQIFWTGQKKTSPRPITLWLEPVITIGTIARLGLDLRWPKDRLGMQSATWAFDFAVYRSANSQQELIAGEVKKTSKEVDQMIDDLEMFGEKGVTELSDTTPRLKNSFKKWLALLECRAPYFWAVGPDRYARAQRVEYGAGSTAKFLTVSSDSLSYQQGQGPDC